MSVSDGSDVGVRACMLEFIHYITYFCLFESADLKLASSDYRQPGIFIAIKDINKKTATEATSFYGKP